MSSPLLAAPPAAAAAAALGIAPSAPPHEEYPPPLLPYHPPFPPLPHAHPLATATMLRPAASAAAAEEEEEEGVQPIHVDEAARRKAEALAAARVREERAKAVLAGREVSHSVRQSVTRGLQG